MNGFSSTDYLVAGFNDVVIARYEGDGTPVSSRKSTISGWYRPPILMSKSTASKLRATKKRGPHVLTNGGPECLTTGTFGGWGPGGRKENGTIAVWFLVRRNNRLWYFAPTMELFAKCATHGTVCQITRCPRSNSGKMLLMDRRDVYLLKAAELTALAENSRYAALKKHFESLAFAYLRLAELAKHNDDLDISLTRHQRL